MWFHCEKIVGSDGKIVCWNGRIAVSAVFRNQTKPTGHLGTISSMRSADSNKLAGKVR